MKRAKTKVHGNKKAKCLYEVVPTCVVLPGSCWSCPKSYVFMHVYPASDMLYFRRSRDLRISSHSAGGTLNSPVSKFGEWFVHGKTWTHLLASPVQVQ